MCLVDADQTGAAPATPTFSSAGEAAVWLAGRGVVGGEVAVLGTDFAANGPDAALVSALAGAVTIEVGERGEPFVSVQAERRRARRVPWIDEDPAWLVRLPGGPDWARVAESIGVLGNGYTATRVAWAGDGGGAPLVAVQGVYDAASGDPQLLSGPIWTAIGATPLAALTDRMLDLRTGVLLGRGTCPPDPRAVCFVSAVRPHAMAMRIESAARLEGGQPLVEPPAAVARPVVFSRSRVVDGVHTATVTCAAGSVVALAAVERTASSAPRATLERIAACVGSPVPDGGASVTACRADVREFAQLGFDRLLAEHRAEWARRWNGACVTIDGDPDAELASRLAVFHLLSAARGDGEAAVGARGLTGRAYGGHVFWDTDVFMLPALAGLNPPAARAVLEYRLRRLPAARAAAATAGFQGARFPWESAYAGTDVTPPSGVDRHGQRVAILTGEHEQHITADVAWSACEYAAWTGDAGFLEGPGRALLMDTARYWASRCEYDGDGRAHLRGVIGPDEYHELVDDNAFTNVMARWHLRRAAGLAEDARHDPDEVAAWRRAADALVDGYQPSTGRYEQFAGYWDREPLLATDLTDDAGGPLIAADLVLGARRVAGSQIIKQADVLMLHHLVPAEVAAGSLAPDLDHYLPRTAHGSSLSPAIHAVLLARVGRPDAALDLFRLAARLDLDDLTRTTAGGLHLATMGGVWQALTYGFLGLRPHADRMDLDPLLPSAWRALSVRLWFHGGIVALRADHTTLTVECAAPLTVAIAGRTHRCLPGTTAFPVGASR